MPTAYSGSAFIKLLQINSDTRLEVADLSQVLFQPGLRVKLLRPRSCKEEVDV